MGKWVHVMDNDIRGGHTYGCGWNLNDITCFAVLSCRDLDSRFLSASCIPVLLQTGQGNRIC